MLMKDHGRIKYLFDQPKLNARQCRWIAIFSEFNFEINYIKGNEKMGVNALSRIIQLNHTSTISCYGVDILEWIKNVGQHDEKY